jgi:proline iminopeptidase
MSTSTKASQSRSKPGLWYETSGSPDALPLVLCHDGPGLSDNLAPVAAMVDDEAFVVRYDQRGGGRSAEVGRPYDIATFVADLEDLRTQLGVERWVVGGHSWGALLALLYCLEHPDRALGLIYLSGPGLDFSRREEASRERMLRLTGSERRELEHGSPPLKRRLHLMWATDFAHRDNCPNFEREPLYLWPRNEAVNRALVAECDRLFAGREPRVRLARLPVRAIVVRGDGDPLPRRGPQEVASLLPNARFLELAGVGHVPWLERPELLREAVRSFLDATLAKL